MGQLGTARFRLAVPLQRHDIAKDPVFMGRTGQLHSRILLHSKGIKCDITANKYRHVATEFI